MSLSPKKRRGPREALPLYEKAYVAGERALGPDAMAEYTAADLFWGAVDTRP
jgi:hypothetical protein